MDEEVLEKVAATPDAGAAGTGYVGEARARLLDEQESLRRQLHAQVCIRISRGPSRIHNVAVLLRI